jgi:uncharacterized coiled-coil protein SlyX
MEIFDAHMGELLTSWLQTSGLGLFIWFLINGLKNKITSLQDVIDAHSKTMEAMGKRIEQLEGIGSIYKNFFSDMPTVMDNYKTILTKDKEVTIVELQQRNFEDAKKLKEAEGRIASISQTATEREMTLKQLNRLLNRPTKEHGLGDKLIIREISEFNGRLIDAAVPAIMSSKTLDEFLRIIGFELRSDLTRDQYERFITIELNPIGSLRQPCLIYSRKNRYIVVTDSVVWSSSSGIELLKADYAFAKNI